MVKAITEQEYIKLRDLAHLKSGINKARLKKEIFVTRLQKRLRKLDMESFSEYYNMISHDKGELATFVDYLSTHTTNFFREPHHFDFMRTVVIPEFVSSHTNRLRVWSAGCSTGEEPYSIAITLLEGLRENGVDLNMQDIKVVASDLSSGVLRTAACGIYRDDELKSLSAELLRRYFLKGTGVYRGLYSVKEEVKELVTFKQINLFESYPHKGLFDLIFCRNVVIYFDEARQRKVRDSLIEYLRPGGYFFCGHSESSAGRHELLEAMDTCTYKMKHGKQPGLCKSCLIDKMGDDVKKAGRG